MSQLRWSRPRSCSVLAICACLTPPVAFGQNDVGDLTLEADRIIAGSLLQVGSGLRSRGLTFLGGAPPTKTAVFPHDSSSVLSMVDNSTEPLVNATDDDRDGVVIQKENRSHSAKGTIVREVEAVTNRSVAAEKAKEKKKEKHIIKEANPFASYKDQKDDDDVSPARASEVHQSKGTSAEGVVQAASVAPNSTPSQSSIDGVIDATKQREDNETKEEAEHLLNNAEHVYSSVTKNVGMKAESGNVTQEAKKPFIKVTKHTQDDGAAIKTSVKVEMVAPTEIMSVYMIMFVPLIVAWTVYWSMGVNPARLAVLLPLTLLATTVGMDFANQSLAAVIAGPHILTALQSWALAFVTGIWTLLFRRPQVLAADERALWYWIAAALAFTVTQLVNHLAYWRCSLYERTVFLNLCPVASVLLEQHVMPKGMKPYVGFWNKTALSITVAGAALLGLQAPAMSSMASIATSSLLVLCMVMCRLTQRFLLGDVAGTLPVSLLACIDGLMLGGTSTLMAFSEVETHRPSLTAWLQEPSVHILLILSMMVFTAYHATVLLILRFTSATNALVFANMGNILNVALGLQFFGDSMMNAFLTPMAFIGLGFSLFSGLWFAAEAEHLGIIPGDATPSGGGPSSQASSISDGHAQGSRRW